MVVVLPIINNTTTKTDKIEVQATTDLVKVPFGPLKAAVTRELEHFYV